MQQAALFPVETIRCPLCVYMTHCGYKAVLGDPEPHGGCSNRSITCLHCGRGGVLSERTERD